MTCTCFACLQGRAYKNPVVKAYSTAIRRLTVAVLLTACALIMVSANAALPDAAWRYERLLIRASLAEFGTDKYVATFGAQVHQESAWDCTARSRFADGCTQFTPDTAKWFAETIGRDLGPALPYDAAWAIPAMVRYMKWIHGRIDNVATACDHIAFDLSAYNGGPGWVSRDRNLCAQNGCDPSRWWGHVENHSLRAKWAITENRGYPRRILKTLTPRYLAAGYRGTNICEV